jgi:hypothetical protein
MADAPKILGTDTLRNAYPKLNSAIDLVNNFQAQVDQLVIEGDSSVEAAQARVSAAGTTFTTLRDRLNNNDASLAGKVNKGQVTVADIDKNQGKFDQTYLTDELLQQIAGTAPINATPSLLGVTTGMLANKSVTYEKTEFMSRGKNYFDYSKAIKDKYPNNTGALLTLVGYSTSDLIYAEAGTYTIKNARWVVVYNGAKQVVNYLDNASTMLHTVTLTENGYIVVSGYDGNQDKYYLQTCQLEKGSTATTFEQYGNRLIKNLDVTDLTNIINTNKTSISTINMSKKLTIYKSGFVYKIRSKFDNTKDIVIETSQVGSSNNSFNFTQTYLVDKGVEPFTNLEVIHSNTDDITPIRTFTTVGANHGYPNIVRITMIGHDKTTADLGSKWTDGVTTYTLLDTYGNDLVFGCPYAVVDGVVSATLINPVANLTHVSGATHTTIVNITTLVSGAQLRPSINNKSLKFILDNVEITTDGTYYGDELQVQESYNIMCYKEVIDFAQSHIGTAYKNDSVAGAVRLSINYVFAEKGAITIHHNFRALKKLSIAACGFIQSVPMSLTGYKVDRYLPNVLPKSGVDFKTPVDLTTYNQSLVFDNVDYINPNLPPNRHIDWLKNTSTGVKKIGFTMGYLVDKTNSKNADRLINTPTGWDMRDTLKSYPIAMSGLTLNAGDYKNFICYRNYLSPNWKSNATNVNIVKDKKDTYVYIDYHINVSFETLKLDDYSGKSITVIEKSADFTLHNDIVDADGVLFSVANNYGYAILKLS